MQTNFYVVNGKQSIITADEGILYGSVRDSVLRVCRSHNIEVERRPPTLDDLQHASGVFITSTSRLVMPVHEVVLGDLRSFHNNHHRHDHHHQDKVNNDNGGGSSKDDDDALPSSYSYSNCATTKNIRKWVLEDV
eukprot:254967_1